MKNDDGTIKEIHCTYVAESKSGNDQSGLKVKSVIHWVNAATAVTAEVRLYDKLFTVEAPDAQDDDFKKFINPQSLQIFSNAKVEPDLLGHEKGERFQFLRLGYFVEDKYSTSAKRIYNRAVTLKDEWAKEQKKQKK